MDWLGDLHEPHSYFDADSGSVPSEDEIWALLRRRWFTRVWVLQEVHLAKRVAVVCGDKEVSWDAFEQLLHWANNSWRRCAEPLPFAVQSITALRTQILVQSYPERLLRTTRRTRELGATEPRDKLYAILPLIEWQYQRHHNADSTALLDLNKGDYSSSAARVFNNLARILIDAIGLEVLRSVETPTAVLGLPSWAPDWTTPEVPPFRTGRVSRREEDLEFSEEFTKSTRDWSFSDYTTSEGDQGTQLQIRSATMVGTVSRIGNVCDVYRDCFPLEQWEGICDPIHLSPCPAEPHVLRDCHCSQQDHELEELPPFIKALFKIRCYPRLMTDSMEMVRRFNNNLRDQEPTGTVPTPPAGSVSYGYSETPSDGT